MTEQQPEAQPATPAEPHEPGPAAGDAMARKLVQDVAAYEIDPPPPARVEHGDG